MFDKWRNAPRWQRWLAISSLSLLALVSLVIVLAPPPEGSDCPTEDEQAYINAIEVHLEAITREARIGEELSAAAQVNPSLGYDPEWVDSYLIQFVKIENLAISLGNVDAPESADLIRIPAKQASTYIKSGARTSKEALINNALSVDVSEDSQKAAQYLIETRAAIEDFCCRCPVKMSG